MSWGGGGVRVDVNQELKFFRKFKKKKLGGGGGGGGRVGPWGVRVSFSENQKKNIFFFWGGGGGGRGGGGRVGGSGWM